MRVFVINSFSELEFLFALVFEIPSLFADLCSCIGWFMGVYILSSDFFHTIIFQAPIYLCKYCKCGNSSELILIVFMDVLP